MTFLSYRKIYFSISSILMICGGMSPLFSEGGPQEKTSNIIALETSKGEPPPLLPTDLKVFEMPGAVLFKGGEWQGIDYLGYLSHEITVDVEIIKGENTPEISKDNLVSYARKLLNSAEIIRPMGQKNHPPMPLLHLLFIIYPTERDRFVLFGNCRLFEEVQVMRPGFISSGFWQAITWESLDVSIASGTNLANHTKDIVDKLVTGFIERYQLYNHDEKPQMTVK